MLDVSISELHNQTDEILKKVEAGTHVRVISPGKDKIRSVAEIVPSKDRSTWMSGPALRKALLKRQADPALKKELDEIFDQTTDDLRY